MSFLKRIFDFILFGNIYVALGTVCLIQSSIIQLQLTGNLFPYSALSFFATLFVYNFQRIFYKPPQPEYTSVRRIWISKNQLLIKILAAVGFIGTIVTLFFTGYKILIYLFPPFALSVLYFAPFILLRKNPWLKLLTLAAVWTMVTAVIPLLLNLTPIAVSSSLLHISTRFWFMVAICIPFDIRDLHIDQRDAVITIPLLTGENKARWIAFGCMLIYGFFIILEYILEMIHIKIFTALIFSALINTIIVLISDTRRSEYFYVAGIDGTMLLQGILLMVAYYL